MFDGLEESAGEPRVWSDTSLGGDVIDADVRELVIWAGGLLGVAGLWWWRSIVWVTIVPADWLTCGLSIRCLFNGCF